MLIANLKPLKRFSATLMRCYVQYHVYLCKKIGRGGSDAYDFIYIKSIFKRAPDSIFHYNHKSLIQK